MLDSSESDTDRVGIRSLTVPTMHRQKKIRLAAYLLFPIVAMVGCHHWPKDSYIQGASSTINTPWGPSTQKAEIIATGKAAQNASVNVIVPTPAKK